MLVETAVAFATLLAAEPAMALVHRVVFHGPLWCWHESHHARPSARRLVRNDLLWLPVLVVAGALIVLGTPVAAGVGVGIASYVTAYVVAHDGVAHGRFPVPRVLRRATFLRVVARTHRLHHRDGRGGRGAPPFAVYAAHLEHRWGLGAGYRPPTKVCAPAGAR